MSSPRVKDFRLRFRLAGIGLVVAALAVPMPSFAQAPTFDAFVSTPKGGEPWFHPGNAAVGDFNGDGKLDALVTDGSYNGVVRLLLGNGDGTFTERDVSVPATPTNPTPGMIKAADLNGDGRLDAVFVSPQGNLAPTVLLNTGNVGGVPQFTVTTYTPVYSGLRSVTVGDLNGDGKPDFIVGNAYGNLYVYLNNGDGTFTAGQATNLEPNVGGSTGAGVIADLNGDGKPDYLVSSNQSSATNIFYGNGDGTLQPPLVYPGNGLFPAVGDLNGDGKPDFAEVDYNTGMLIVYLNNGNGTFSGPAQTATGLINPASLVLTDISGDGKLDAVVSDFGSFGVNGVAVYLGNGDGTFGAANSYTVNRRPLNVAVRDFNGDGKLDIATVGYEDNTYGVLLNNSVTADTTPPNVTVVPGDQVVEATGPSGAVVTFSAHATDPDDAAGPVTCTRPSGSTFGFGTTNVVCSSTDTHNNTGSTSFNVLVRDTTAPAITAVTPSQTSLWPPNKKMVPISVAVATTDAVTVSPGCKITSVTSNEPGSDQWVITAPLTLQLQADRLGTGNGRIYTISVTCTDAAGNASSRSTTVIVPHDQGK
jgi:hypothetical protein